VSDRIWLVSFMHESVTYVSGRNNPSPMDRNGPEKIWRRRPDLNRGWRFCRGHPRSFFVDRPLVRSRQKSHHVNQLRSRTAS